MKPILIVIAGPNGAGKTTVTERIRRDHWSDGVTYLDPDEVARDRFGDWNARASVLEAAEWVRKRREELVAVFESCFSRLGGVLCFSLLGVGCGQLDGDGDGGVGSGGGASIGGFGGASAEECGAHQFMARTGEDKTCSPWTVCNPGTFVSEPGTETSDTVCLACPPGTFAAESNQTSCEPMVSCPAGTRQAVAATASAEPRCAACPSGSYCPGGATPGGSCATGSWDDDANSATACVLWSDCPAGSYVDTSGEPTSDRTCMACLTGYTHDRNEEECRTWSTCSPGTYIATEGSAIEDRSCAVCSPEFVSTTNESAACYFAQVAIGGSQTCVLMTDGGLRCWGSPPVHGLGIEDKVGDNELPASFDSVDVGGTVKQVVAGGNQTCALLSDGDVRCWGHAQFGVLGYANLEDIGDDETPADVGVVDIGGSVKQLSSGLSHTCALLTDGNVRCWGKGASGRLGYGNTNDIGDDEEPTSAGNVDVGGAVAQVAAGGFHTCALLTDGKVRCWGSGNVGVLGYGNTADIGDDEVPGSAGDVDVGGAVVAIAAGYRNTCALLVTGGVRCWGATNIGYMTTENIGDDETPASAGDLSLGGAAVSITVGFSHACSLLADGDVVCWGRGLYGQLGYGNTDDIGDDETPASAGAVPLGGRATQVSASFRKTCALLVDGNVRCWGEAYTGALGYGLGTVANVGDDETPADEGNVPYF